MTTEGDPIPLLTSGLALAARCNGVPAAQSSGHEDLLAGMFDRSCGELALSRRRLPGDPWDDLTLALSTWAWGKKGGSWSDFLFDLVAARQGGEPLAINAGRLKAVLERIGQEWELLSPTTPVLDAVKRRAQEAGAIHPGSEYLDAKKIRTKVAVALDAEANRLNTWLDRVSAELGEARDVKDLTTVIDVVEEALDSCVSAGQAGIKVQEVRIAGSAVRPEDVPGLLAACRDVLSATDRGTKLAHRSRYDADLEQKLTAWLDRISVLYKAVEERVAPAPKGNSPDPVAAEIEKQVEAARELEKEFQEGVQS